MKRLISVILIAIFAFCLCSCQTSQSEVKNTYIWEKGDLKIFLKNNGAYSYEMIRSGIFSITKTGKWTAKGDIYTLTDDDPTDGETKTFNFRFEKDRLIFIAEGSSGFSGLKVENGDRFYLNGVNDLTEAPTDEPTQTPTEVPTEDSTETPTEMPTEAPTEEPTEQPTEAPTEKEEVEYMTYIRSKGGIGGDFAITLANNGTYSYYEGALSSIIGSGNWNIEDDEITLVDDFSSGQIKMFRFKQVDNKLIFVESESNQFTYVHCDDGDVFILEQDINENLSDQIDGTNRAFIWNRQSPGGSFIIILRDDGTYSYQPGNILTHFVGSGNYVSDNGVLTLTDDFEKTGSDKVFHFRDEGDHLTFISEGSDPLYYSCIISVEDGDSFYVFDLINGLITPLD